jgi:hypothetical protein
LLVNDPRFVNHPMVLETPLEAVADDLAALAALTAGSG